MSKIKLQYFYLICFALFVIIISVILIEQPIFFGIEASGSKSALVQIVDKININTAIKEELLLLEGIGDKKAADIIEYRKINGVFSSIEQLKNVDGISDKLYNDIKNFITIE